MKLLAVFILTVTSLAAAGPSGFPFTDESLRYTIAWPSGLSLGEATLTATRGGEQWVFGLNLDASVPAFPVRDRYRAVADLNLCAAEFNRDTLHGTRKTAELTTISGGTAVRQTANGGGKTTIAVGGCAHDALNFLFLARRELAQGRVPAAQRILFGTEYEISLQYLGSQNVTTGGVVTPADRVVCSVRTHQPQPYTFEVYFARDAARTPILVRVPFAVGAISMELVR